MQWIFLIGENLNIDRIRNIDHEGAIRTDLIDSTEFIVSFGRDYIIYQYIEDLLDEYEKYDPESLPKIPYKNPTFIMMRYREEETLKKILRQENFLRNI
ncbi:hypothetical protein [Paenibacillus sp. JDR-2]|uniref:hypothetical protein n=1 Tax=Paenibacillus sp. (strain JDR-2) TaxID=324057 RepID=UPI000166A3A2|nr:hypothetical protein [Paenibacillus sp. JDR-2]ACT00712.1 hypothetical protein Pjdr2_2055 [Paenibacillus sp. JDR-2]